MRDSGSLAIAAQRRRTVAWLLLLVADAGFVAWGAMAALLPDLLPGPGGTPILTAGYQGFTGLSWFELVRQSPMTAHYMEVLFRMYGVFNVVFGLMAIAVNVMAFRRGESWSWWTLLVGNTIAFVSAMAYDKTVNAIGPFELSEYLGLAITYGALTVTAPFASASRLGASS